MSWEVFGAVTGVAGVLVAIIFGVIAYRQGKAAKLANVVADRSTTTTKHRKIQKAETEDSDTKYVMWVFIGMVLYVVTLIAVSTWYDSGGVQYADRNECFDVKRRVACDDPSAQFKVVRVIPNEPKDSKRCEPNESLWIEFYKGLGEPALLCTTPIP